MHNASSDLISQNKVTTEIFTSASYGALLSMVGDR